MKYTLTKQQTTIQPTATTAGFATATKIAMAISLACSLSVISQQSLANDVEDIDENILVTANRSVQDKFLSLSAAEVITSEQIKTMQIGNISELLDTVAGISVASQGGAGQASSIFMRGTNSNHTLILIDGVRVSSATLGASNLNAISPSQIERIEVVKGPRAALWGSDALGGVIQIFTKQLQSGEANIGVGFGSNGLLQADAAIGLGDDNHNLTISVSTERADGFNIYSTDPYPYDVDEPDEDGYDRIALSVVGNSQLNDDWSLQLVSRYESGNNEYDASYPDSPCWDDPSAACPSFYANEQDHENYSIKLASRYQSNNLMSELAISTSQDEGETYGNGIAKSDADRITTERDQVSFINQYSFTANSSVNFGLEYYNEKVSTNTDKDPWTPGFQGWDIDERDVKAVFLQAQNHQDKLLLEAAIRYDDVEEIDSETTYNVAIGYQLTDNWLISLNRGTGFKAPTFNDLYWPGSGNPDLISEEITNTEILVRHQYTNDSFDSGIELTVFDSEIDNLIAWAPNDSGLWQPDNINAAEISGIEATANFDFSEVSNKLAIAFIDTEDSDTGKQLLRRPELTATYTLGYDWQDFTFTSVVSYRDESIDSGDAKLDSYVLVDLGVSYQATSNLVIIAKVNNVLDEDYETALNYHADGSNFKASLNYSF